VSCKLTSKTKITCTVKYVSSSRRAKKARLVRGGRTVARASVARGKVSFRARRTLAKGRYTVVVGSTRTSFRLR
jgi:hypothetical protein